MMPSSGAQVTVPPGFRFHPTDEELLYYYLRKKVAYEAIDLDVIREVDVNKLEPWDLKEKCRIGTGPQNEWYFFSHKDKKYPTGTRTNRATHAGFWKATGRDKAIHLSSTRRIGMRKTLVFYTGRAPHGQKTDWIMHEYRLDDENSSINQEEGWVVCRVFKKKSYQRGILPPEALVLEEEEEEEDQREFMINSLKQQQQQQQLADQKQNFYGHIPSSQHNHLTFNTSMHLPQLMSSESSISSIPTAIAFSNNMTHSLDLIECSHSLMKLTSSAGEAGGGLILPAAVHQMSVNGELSILDKLLLASHQNLDQLFQMSKCGSSSNNNPSAASQLMDLGASSSVLQRNPNLQYLGCEPDLVKFSN